MQGIDVAVILVEPEFESTIGFLARVMKNFEITELRLVNPLARIGREAHMRASHAQEVLDNTKIFADLETALDGVNLSVGTTAQRASSVFRIVRKPVTPSELVHILGGVAGKLAIVFGREGTGLTNEELQLCELTMTIHASPQYPTLNVSHAAAIVFHEFYTESLQVSHGSSWSPSPRGKSSCRLFPEASESIGRERAAENHQERGFANA